MLPDNDSLNDNPNAAKNNKDYTDAKELENYLEANKEQTMDLLQFEPEKPKDYTE